MKTALTDLGPCRKELAIEIPAAAVDAAIERISARYGRSARIQGFRPGKAPLRVVRARFREQILRDVAEDLIPAAVDDAIAERGVQPVAPPDIRGVDLDAGRPLTCTARFETLPDIDPGDCSAFTLRQSPATVHADAVDQAIERLRRAQARLDPVEGEGEGAAAGDIVTLDLERRLTDPPGGAPERLTAVRVEIGSDANPPGFDDALIGTAPGAARTFTVTHPDTDPVRRLAGRTAAYAVDVTAVHRPVLPAVDDAFARSLGEIDDLAALRARVEADLRAAAEQEGRAEVRSDLLRQLAARHPGGVPEALIARELDRRVEQVVRRLIAEQVDPRQAGVDWDAFRTQQRPAAETTVRGTLVLDEIARREGVEVTDADLQQEVERQAAHAGRTPAAARALIEKDGGLDRLRAALRREQAIARLLARATIVQV